MIRSLSGKRPLATLVALTIAVLVLAGCGSEATPTPSGQAEATPTPTTEAGAPTATPTVESDIAAAGPTPTPTPLGDLPEYGGVMEYISCCSGVVSSGIDQHRNIGCFHCTWLSGNSLIQMKFPFDPSKGVEYEPSLAATWEQTGDGSEWVLNLRRGVTFHDGQEFNADDVIATFERVLDEETLIMTRLVGLRDVVSSVEKVDDYTVVVDTGVPNSTTFAWLSTHYFVMYPEHLIRGPDPSSEDVEQRWRWFGTNEDEQGLVVATGPFEITEWRSQEELTMVRNESYWKRDERGNPLPYMDGWHQVSVPDGTRRLARFAAGDVAYTQGQGAGLHPDKAQEICNNTRDPDCYVMQYPHGFFAVVLNPESTAQFQDPRIVAASRYAIDAQEIFEIAYGGRLGYTWMDRGRFPATALPVEEQYEVIPWSNPDRRDEFKERAVELIAEAGFPDGFDLPHPIFSSGLCTGSFLDQYSRMVDQWFRAGIRGSLECREGIIANDELRAGRFSIEGPGDSIWFLDPSYSLLQDALLDAPIVGNAPWRWEGQVELDAMYRETVRTIDEAQRNEGFRDIERYLADTSFTVWPMAYSTVNLAVHGCVRNFRPGGTWDSHSWSHEKTWLEEECR